MKKLEKRAKECSSFNRKYFYDMIEDGEVSKLHTSIENALEIAYRAGFREGSRNPEWAEEESNPIRDY